MYQITEQDLSKPLSEIEQKIAEDLAGSPFEEGSPYFHRWNSGLAGPYISWLGLDFANNAYADPSIIDDWKEGRLFSEAPYKDIDSYMETAKEHLIEEHNPEGFDETDVENDAVENCATQYAYDHFKTFMALEAIKALEDQFGPDERLSEKALKAALEVSQEADTKTRAEAFRRAVKQAVATAA